MPNIEEKFKYGSPYYIGKLKKNQMTQVQRVEADESSTVPGRGIGITVPVQGTDGRQLESVVIILNTGSRQKDLDHDAIKQMFEVARGFFDVALLKKQELQRMVKLGNSEEQLTLLRKELSLKKELRKSAGRIARCSLEMVQSSCPGVTQEMLGSEEPGSEKQSFELCFKQFKQGCYKDVMGHIRQYKQYQKEVKEFTKQIKSQKREIVLLEMLKTRLHKGESESHTFVNALQVDSGNFLAANLFSRGLSERLGYFTVDNCDICSCFQKTTEEGYMVLMPVSGTKKAIATNGMVLVSEWICFGNLYKNGACSFRSFNVRVVPEVFEAISDSGLEDQAICLETTLNYCLKVCDWLVACLSPEISAVDMGPSVLSVLSISDSFPRSIADNEEVVSGGDREEQPDQKMTVCDLSQTEEALEKQQRDESLVVCSSRYLPS